MKSIEVVAAVIHHEDKIFATQRGYGDQKGGWENLKVHNANYSSIGH